jgi:hypothetical protein
MRFTIAKCCFGLLVAFSAAVSANTGEQAVAVSSFATAKNVKLPDGYIASMMRAIVDELKHAKCFSDVYLENGLGTPAREHTLVLSGEVTGFKAGSRAARFLSQGLAGYAATKGGHKGQAEAVAHVRFVDALTGRVVLEQDVHAYLRNHPMSLNMGESITGGDPRQTAKAIAKEIAKLARNHFSQGQ